MSLEAILWLVTALSWYILFVTSETGVRAFDAYGRTRVGRLHYRAWEAVRYVMLLRFLRRGHSLEGK